MKKSANDGKRSKKEVLGPVKERDKKRDIESTPVLLTSPNYTPPSPPGSPKPSSLTRPNTLLDEIIALKRRVSVLEQYGTKTRLPALRQEIDDYLKANDSLSSTAFCEAQGLSKPYVLQIFKAVAAADDHYVLVPGTVAEPTMLFRRDTADPLNLALSIILREVPRGRSVAFRQLGEVSGIPDEETMQKLVSRLVATGKFIVHIHDRQAPFWSRRIKKVK